MATNIAPPPIKSSKRNPCPICQNHSGCKFDEDLSRVWCLRIASQWEVPSGYRLAGWLGQGMGASLIAGHEKLDSQQREEHRRERQQQRQQRLKEEAERLAQALSEKERDREIRKILEQLELKPEHRADLQRRGLTDEQIKAGLFRSADKWQKLEFEVSHHLAGVDVSGRSLTNSAAGYLCPIWSVDGLIVGWQLRTDKPVDGAKYLWATSKNKKRPNGPTSHLQNGELPITVCRPISGEPKQIRLDEGTLKPWIAAQLSGDIVIGASGGQFATSPKQLAEILAKLATELGDLPPIILDPDAGSVENRHVYARNCETIKLLQSLGYTPQIADWGQLFDKSQPDYDELLATGRRSYGLLTADEFLAIHSVPTSDRTAPQTISQGEWEERFKLPEQIKGLASYIQQAFGRLARQLPKPKGFAAPALKTPVATPQTSSAIALWQPPLNLLRTPLQYVPGELPTPDEWIAMDRPSIAFKGGDRIPLLREMYAKGYSRVWDSSYMGQGKTHNIGDLRGELFQSERDGEQVIPQIFYNAVNHRNPDTATVESFADVPSRHDGLVTDKTRKTASGYSHVVRPKPGQKADIPGNCPESQTFLLLNQEKNLTVRGGKGSPICESCPLFKNEEGQISCEFLIDRFDTLNHNTEIRQHLDQSTKAKADAIGIVEEAGATLKPYRQITAAKKDLAHSHQELKVADPRLAECVSGIFDALYRMLDVPELPRYGLDFEAILAKLPTREQLAAQIWTIYSDEFLRGQNPWDVPSVDELSSIIYKKLLPNVAELIYGIDSPAEKQAILRENVPLNWISLVLDAIVANKAHLRIDAQGLHITKRTQRYKAVLESYKMLVLADSTSTKSDLALLTGFKKDSIVEIHQHRPNNERLTITLVTGFGRLGQSRETEGEFCAQSRFEKLLADVASRHKRPGIIDHQKFSPRYATLQAGYWGRDNRGSNAFKDCDALVLAGDPIPNLGQLAAEYHALTGKIVNPSRWEGGFGAWVRRHIASESVQAGARLRSHLSPSPKHLYIISNSTPTETWRRFFPGATLETISAAELCQAAAPKGEQRERALLEVMRDALANGLDFTQTTLADKLNLSRGRISQLAKAICEPLGIKTDCFGTLKSLLISLIDSSLRKINTPGELTDAARWIAQNYLPDLLSDDAATPDEKAAAIASELLGLARDYGRPFLEKVLNVSDATPRLLGVLLGLFVPKPDLVPA